MSKSPRRFLEFVVEVSGTITGTFHIEKQMIADNAEEAGRRVREELKKGTMLDPLSPKVQIGKLKVATVKSDNIKHYTGE